MTFLQSLITMIRMTKYGIMFDVVLYALMFFIFGGDWFVYTMLGISIGMFFASVIYMQVYGVVPPGFLRDKESD